MTSSPYVACSETAANGIRGEPTRLRRWPIKPQALCRDARQGPGERIPLPRMVGRDCARGGSHSGSRQLADKDEAEVQALPGPPLALTSATLAKHRRGLVVVRITGRCARNSGCEVLAHGPLSGECRLGCRLRQRSWGDPGLRCQGMPVTAGWVCACGRGGHGRNRTCAGSRRLTLSVPSSCMVRVISLVRMSTARWTPRSPPAISPYR
jgi:hypothetical protein